MPGLGEDNIPGVGSHGRSLSTKFEAILVQNDRLQLQKDNAPRDIADLGPQLYVAEFIQRFL